MIGQPAARCDWTYTIALVNYAAQIAPANTTPSYISLNSKAKQSKADRRSLLYYWEAALSIELKKIADITDRKR
jgi:hypothetical protein